MNIAVIGAGNVGGTLGSRWAQAGHQVVFSSRNPDSKEMKDVVARAGSSARSAPVAEAAAASDVILFATPWDAAHSAIRSAGDLSGKVVIDAINPLLPDLSGLQVGTTISAGEQVQQWASGAKVVKAFNTIGYNIMANPRFDKEGTGSERAMLAYCGDDAGAKAIVRQLAEELGFDPLDAGPLTQARLLEPFALLWITLAYKAGQGREIAFKFLKRN